MTDQDFQKIVLEKLTDLEENQSRMERNMPTKDDLLRIETKVDLIASELPQDIIGILKLMDNKLDVIATKDDLARVENIVDVLSTRTTRQEAEIMGLKRAK